MNEIEYELREQDLLAFSEHQIRETKALKKRRQRHQSTIPAFFVVISLFLWFYYKDLVSAAYVGVIALAWGFLVPAYMRWTTRKQLLAMYSDEDKQRILGRYRLSVAKDALIENKLDGEESRIPWSEILRIELTDKYAFIFVAIDAALIVPRATANAAKLRDFVRAADERIAAAD
ncbi:MAG: YcxB family protein [Pseudomonadota bacterium]|jgi:hypothetical protein